jgi:crotonobetainyl-CoA:carnitine CoA-transferase CaiB-like acyl-CoA transferase
MLSGLRVLDLSTERAFLFGQILGDLGADVIKVEPVGGAPARALPPFIGERPGSDNSIYWLAYNRNKRGITLDLGFSTQLADSPARSAQERSASVLKQLVAKADILIESENPGEMAERGLDYVSLSKINPALIYVSITPFGQDGPKAAYADSDLIVMAAGGVLSLYGDEDRAPIRMSVPQAYLHASADAAGAALIAYYERLSSGLGQAIDIAAQESIAPANQSSMLAALIEGEETRRMAGGAKLGTLRVPLVWPCKDGQVSCVFLFGSALGVFTRRLSDYLFSQGACDQMMKDTDWISYGAKLLSGEEPMSRYDEKQGVIGAWLMRHTKAELFEIAREHNLLIAPVATMADVRVNPQFVAREFWQTIAHPNGTPLVYPGAFARMSATPITMRRRPPMIGEHNREILGGELGLSDRDLADLTAQGVI